MVSREDAHRATGNSEHGGTGMAKIDESKLGDDFSYIFRIAESDIDGLSPISIGLTSIKGIGLRTSQQICRLSGIDSKKLGKILNFRCIYGKSKMITFESNDWRSKRKFSGGGILLDQGIHMLDLIKYFYGEFSEFYSCISNNYWNYNVEDNAFILLRDKTGVVAFLHSTATQWQHKFLMEITLQKGSIELGGILSGTKSYGSEKITILSKNDIKNKKKGKTYSFNADNSWKEEIKEFSDLILKKKNKKAEGNIVDAEKIMLTIDKIYRADKKWYNSFIKNN